MPYRRNRYYRRYRRYVRRPLSNRNIYMNRSSRSQAVQIAALKKKVNKVYRACKPETKVVVDDSPYSKTFNNNLFANSWDYNYPLEISTGETDQDRNGNTVFRQDKYRYIFTYSNNASSTSGLHNDETSMGYIRIICGIWKEPKGVNACPTPDSVLSSWGTTSTAYKTNIIQPLSSGITAEHNIVYDKTFKISLSNPSQIVKIRTPFYSSVYDKNGYFVHSWILIITGDLDWDSSFSEQIEAYGVRKTVFKDA